MTRFEFKGTSLDGVVVVQRKIIEDDRGFFSRFYCAGEFRNAGFDLSIAQINHTLTKKKGAVRGLHFQYPPHAETKLVSCLSGEIWDVVVDLRRDSPTFLQWYGEFLSAANHKSLLIPEGFAHGFQAITSDCELIYLHSEFYHSQAEGALNVVDSELNIPWPLPISDLSERDQNHPHINTNNFQGVDV